MPSCTSISVENLAGLIGTPGCPAVLDVRLDEDVSADSRLIPAAMRRGHADLASETGELADRPVVVVCQRGQKLSQGAAAWLRHRGAPARSLEGGFEAWRDAGQLLLRAEAVPPRDGQGRSVWVTRERPKIDRIACPWLIRRFVDPSAVFLFVEPAEVQAAAERFAATPFDVEGVFWSHRGERCTFDTMLEEFGLRTPALDRLAAIVRGADTARLDLSPEAAGLLAASLGLSRMYEDDLRQLEAGLSLYDMVYRWCRDAVDETHNWPASAARAVQP